MKKIIATVLATTMIFSLTACNTKKASDKKETATTTEKTETTQAMCERFADLRNEDDSKKVMKKGEYSASNIYTYTFNDSITFEGNEEKQKEVMEQGKNPGLGIRDLHSQGITGKGVNVAIVDQNLLLDHPEFAGKIVEYYDTGCKMDKNNGSMHGPAVTSALVGKDIGVAPDAKVYYAAAPSWEQDSNYYAKGIQWIIKQNKKLPANEKIKVISISAAPTGKESEFNKGKKEYEKAVKAAQKEGILVLDCCGDQGTGFICPAFYDPREPENVEKCTGGFPNDMHTMAANMICVPCSYRTMAEEYYTGKATYRYDGIGGLSWGIPYAAGVLALGWQVAPEKTNKQMKDLLYSTSTKANDGSKIINPKAFIEALQK